MIKRHARRVNHPTSLRHLHLEPLAVADDQLGLDREALDDVIEADVGALFALNTIRLVAAAALVNAP